MSMLDLARRMKYLWHRDEFANQLDEEMRLHLELRARRLNEQGMNADAARLAARRRFGNRAAMGIASSEAWGWTAWERLVQDVRQALRALRKTPAFTAVVVATLAVGLGMNTAVFSIVNAVMLRSLPYRQPDRLVSLWEEVTKRQNVGSINSSGQSLGGAGNRQRTTVSVANLVDYRKGTDAFEALAGVAAAQMNLTGNGSPERLSGESVTAEYFSVLGVTPEIGRTFTAEEDRPEANPVVVVSHDFWQRRLGGDTAVLSRTLLLDDRVYQVIGVMPRGFQAATQFGQVAPVEFFVPAAYSKQLLASHGDHEVGVVGRLKSGASLRAAQEQLDAVSASLEKQYPDTNLGIRAVISPLRDDLVQNVKDSLRALWGASGLIVLITCVNVANLLLVRAVGRRHETSVRLSLGAGRMRIVRQFLAESMVLAAAGCASGLLLGRIFMRALVAAAPQSVPRLDTVSLDWTVFGVAAAIATFTGLGFGLAPAWQASRTSPAESSEDFRTQGHHAIPRPVARGPDYSRGRAVPGAAHRRRAILEKLHPDYGNGSGIPHGECSGDEHQLAGIALPYGRPAIPVLSGTGAAGGRANGVQSVAFANRLPLRGGWGTGISIDGLPDGYRDADSQAVNVGYFETLGIPLLRGRLLTPADRQGGPHVAVVNQAFSRQFLNGGDRHRTALPAQSECAVVRDRRPGQ